MKELHIWKLLLSELALNGQAALLLVVESKGSSPGRVGFKMAVSKDEAMAGSVGGGIMEHKIVEMVRDRMRSGQHFWELRRQVHSKEAPKDQSGMICSGEQQLAILRLQPDAVPRIMRIVEAIESRKPCLLTVDGTKLTVTEVPAEMSANKSFLLSADGSWQYQEILGTQDTAHVVGAGHVGLETCKILSFLDFHVINYDDRAGLNTMAANEFAAQKIVAPYKSLADFVHSGDNAYVVVMTFGYRGDDEAVRALIKGEYRYFGMMGSQAKVDKLLQGLRDDGYLESDIAKIRTPAGLVAHCKTPTEIAVSVAAEIIAIRNATT